MIVLILVVLIHFYIVITQLEEQNKIFRNKLSILIEKIIKLEEDVTVIKLDIRDSKDKAESDD